MANCAGSQRRFQPSDRRCAPRSIIRGVIQLASSVNAAPGSISLRVDLDFRKAELRKVYGDIRFAFIHQTKIVRFNFNARRISLMPDANLTHSESLYEFLGAIDLRKRLQRNRGPMRYAL